MTTFPFGFEPEIKMRPSGTREAEEWYNRSIEEEGKFDENRFPGFCVVVYKTGWKTG